MFEGLKEKLGSFREDAEEVAEEAAEDDTDQSAAAPETAAAQTSSDADVDDELPVADEDAAGGGSEEAAESDAEDDGPSLGEKAKSLATGKVILDEDDLEGPLWDLEMALLESDVEMSVAEAILDTIEADLTGERRGFTERTENLVEAALRDALLEVIAVGQFDFDEYVAASEKPVVIVFTGVNGVGKTTTIAKLAKYLEERGYSSVLANGDTYRAGANEQIQEHADRLEKKLIHHEQGGDPTAVIYDAVEYAEANDVDVVLGDTAGRLHTSNDLMAQLEKLDRIVEPDLTIFVDEAVAGQDAVNRAKEFDSAASIDGTILTMADADAQGGAAISIAYVTGKPILFLGTGQGYDDIEKFDPEGLVDDLLGEE
ncbi:Signal recognition particle GTPase [Halanaeroarchaeum sp. HSR-CO]|uniref:signal recognition particle-docking protein FtsY n=1 Tax=Halanaeroarchaeum sp. HSR-CO TaxID=2866382 RepID=UPI00217EFDE9|nr:signal recognition particle-docking protein FtsY [Halanaeroarchaeum sp. HSR-CO]UWG49068.1 Signal recognition particle GTPase [Halanaeroarchaeum sp. HSR-CO]